jgi:hypothetical protein
LFCSIAESIALGNFQSLFLIVAQEDHISRRASHDIFKVIRHETRKAQGSPVDLLPKEALRDLGQHHSRDRSVSMVLAGNWKTQCPWYRIASILNEAFPNENVFQGPPAFRRE